MADRRHMRDTDARTTAPLTTPSSTSSTGSTAEPPAAAPRRTRRPSRAVLVAGPLALLATAGTVAVGVATSDAGTEVPFAAQGSIVDVTSVERPQPVSRAGTRLPGLQRAYDRNLDKLARAEAREAALRATRKAVAAADTRLWATAPLNLWTLPGKDGRKVGLLEEEQRVLVTGREAAGRTEVVVDGRSRWVTSGYLTDEKPQPTVEEAPEAEAAATDPGEATCSNGTSVSPGVSQNIVAVHAATCANFPEITTYGDFRGDGEHAQGIAVDIMVSGSRGWEVAEYLRANYAELGINYLIYSQKIWSVERSSEGWRYMEDRGSVTANHYDHVHVTTY